MQSDYDSNEETDETMILGHARWMKQCCNHPDNTSKRSASIPTLRSRTSDSSTLLSPNSPNLLPSLHFFIDGVQQPHHCINIPVPLVFALSVYHMDVTVEIMFWGELKRSNVTFQGTGHTLG
ncbi:hypothetical protein BLNAU_10896 [Blattamonas nauphoetae]|uniref:Uncharacterized protein n=1 Tax=Blattamonas nauphoetae TaxID=2049346 RepID=A0ABQ9XQN2_9EUKA|nr:hypothetical protein BLNAU_10896 [Blattamonas nauphoetae]